MLRRVGLEALAVGLPVLVVLLGEPAFEWSVAAGLLACAALPLRHRWPRLALVLGFPGLAGGLGWAPTLVALYAVGRRARGFLEVVPWLVPALAAAVVPVFATQDLRWQQGVLTVGFVLVNVTAPVVVGLLVGTRAHLVASLAELDRVREKVVTARSAAARAEERERIGREIHDAVGHHITLIAVSSAALAASTREDHTRAAAEQMRVLAKRSLDEVRSALGLTGAPDRPAVDPAGVDQVAQLVADWRAAGHPVRLVEAASTTDLCPVVGVAAYRVVQESLTNTARHAAGAPVQVRLTRSDEHFGVRIDNDAAEPPGSGPREIWTGGVGLVGLATRVDVLGGHFRAGPRPDGGFTVDARFPLEIPAGTHEGRPGGATSDGGVPAGHPPG